jgi:hypothetical protein
MIETNMDCTFCFDCARACPYDNVVLSTRSPGTELIKPPKFARWDRALLLIGLAFMGLTNAFGMVPPVYALQTWLGETFGLQSDAIRLLIVFGLGNLLLPALLMLILAKISGELTGSRQYEQIAGAYAGAFVPIGLAIWLAHYGFHLAIGGAAIIPVFHSFLLDHGIILGGVQPNWSLSFLLPQNLIFPLQILALMGGFAGSLLATGKIALNRRPTPASAFRELLPWAILIVLMTIAALSIFNLPMEMRGTRMIGI